MDVVLSGTLRLLHPLMPHLTEELWKHLGYEAPASASAIGSRAGFLLYTQPPAENLLGGLSDADIAAATARTTALYAAVHAVRNLRAEFKIPSKQQVRFLVNAKGDVPSIDRAIFAALTRASEVTPLTGSDAAPTGTPSVLTDLGTIHMPLEGLIDLEAEKVRITSEITKVEAEIAKVQAKLADTAFVEKVPSTVLEEHRQRLAKWSEKLETLKTTLKTLG